MSIHSLPEPAIKSTLTLSVSMSRSKLMFTLRESRLGPFPGACLDYIHSLKARDSGVVIPPVWWWFPLCGGEQRGRYQPQLVAPPHQRFCDVAAVCCCCQLSFQTVWLLDQKTENKKEKVNNKQKWFAISIDMTFDSKIQGIVLSLGVCMVLQTYWNYKENYFLNMIQTGFLVNNNKRFSIKLIRTFTSSNNDLIN